MAGSAGLLVSGSPGSWVATEAPIPANANASPYVYLSAISCGTAGSCEAVGDYVDSGKNQRGLILRETPKGGGAWTETQAPLPTNAAADPSVNLNAIWCDSSLDCVISGSYDAAGQVGLVLNQSGKIVPTEVNGGLDSGVGELACSSETTCWAIGGSGPSPDDTERVPEIVTESNGVWSVADAPLPANGQGVAGSENGLLESISCTPIGECVATGGYEEPTLSISEGLIESSSS
jgi:hypothetical protein